MNHISLISKGSLDSQNFDTQRDEWQARFSQGLLGRGVVAGKYDFSCNWVRRLIGFVKPRKWSNP